MSACFHRSEARTVPNLLVAESSAAQKPADLSSDHRQGYYADGAYTAAPAPDERDFFRNGSDEEDEEDAQEAYYAAFRTRFRSFSSLLEHSPPSNLISPSASNTAQKLSSGMKSPWRSAFGIMPTTTILGQLPQESVLLGLQVLESRLANGDRAKKKFLGPWAWGLLARCREAGQMGSEEIGILRDLGKRAVWLLRGLRAGTDYLARERAQEGDNSDVGSDNGNEDAEVDARDPPSRDRDHQRLERTTASVPPAENTLPSSEKAQIASSSVHGTERRPDDDDDGDILAAAKTNLLSTFMPEPPATTTTTTTPSAPAHDAARAIANGHPAPETDDDDDQCEQTAKLAATLDMIITIIGEFYGQRDLLEGRLVWGETDLGD